jgi:hypothetical protein
VSLHQGPKPIWHRHYHWHQGMAHEHTHDHAGEREHHAAAPFGRKPNVTHIGSDLVPELEASIKAVKERDDN